MVSAIARALIGAANDFGEGNQIAGDVWQLADAATKAAAPEPPQYPAPGPALIPAPVLEALASAGEDQAERSAGVLADRAEVYSNCARMLREAITHGGAG